MTSILTATLLVLPDCWCETSCLLLNAVICLLTCLQVGVTISKPGVKGEIPVGVIVGSVIGGLLLLALVIGLLWKVCASLLHFMM